MDGSKQEEAKKTVDQARDTVINAISETMDLYGVTPSIGRLYGTLFFKNHPMTLDEMKDDLGMSKPSMSTAVRKLQDINIVQKVWQKGSRKDAYTAEKDFFLYFVRFFCSKWEREVGMFLEAIRKAESNLKRVLEDETIDENIKEQARLDFKQLMETKAYYHWLQRLVDTVESEEIFEFLPKENKESLK